MRENVEALCLRYTDLSVTEINTLKEMTKLLQPMADMNEADIFIDCPIPGGDAIVVAEANPQKSPSAYHDSVLGMLAKRADEPAVARSLSLGESTKQMKALTQENLQTIQTVEPIVSEHRIIGVLIQEKRREEQLGELVHLASEHYESIARFVSHLAPEDDSLAELIDEALLIIDSKGKVSFRNGLAKQLYEQLGYVEDVLGQPYRNISLTKEPELLAAYDEEHEYTEIEIGDRVIGIKKVELHTPDTLFVLLMKDFTKQKEQERVLILKSAAIQEMHHRVKNNLQTIASLLRLQMRRTEVPEAKRVLEDTMQRIMAITGTHQILAKAGTDDVYLREVLSIMINNAKQISSTPAGHIEITLEGEDFMVDAEIATSISLVVNELLTNAIKHAFEEHQEGMIRVVITPERLYSRIDVIDNGKGIDPKAERTKQQMGLTLVNTMVKDKLKGRFTLESGEEGTKASFDFKNRLNDL